MLVLWRYKFFFFFGVSYADLDCVSALKCLNCSSLVYNDLHFEIKYLECSSDTFVKMTYWHDSLVYLAWGMFLFEGTNVPLCMIWCRVLGQLLLLDNNILPNLTLAALIYVFQSFEAGEARDVYEVQLAARFSCLAQEWRKIMHQVYHTLTFLSRCWIEPVGIMISREACSKNLKLYHHHVFAVTTHQLKSCYGGIISAHIVSLKMFDSWMFKCNSTCRKLLCLTLLFVLLGGPFILFGGTEICCDCMTCCGFSRKRYCWTHKAGFSVCEIAGTKGMRSFFLQYAINLRITICN